MSNTQNTADAVILRLAAEWRKVVDRNDKSFDETGRPDKTAVDRMWAIEAELGDLPAHTIAGVIAKLKPILFDDIDRRKLLEGAIADLERLAKGAASG